MNVLETRTIPRDIVCRQRSLHDFLFSRRDDVVLHESPDRELARSLLLQCERHPTIRRFIYCSSGQVYRRTAAEPNVLDENALLDYERAAADLTICARMATSRLSITVLRFADSWDAARKMRVRPLGFDPMVNLITAQDRAHAIECTLRTGVSGIFNIPGADTLPLSLALADHPTVPLPFLFRLRFGGILDGTLARFELGYVASRLKHEGACGLSPSASASSPVVTS